MGVINQMEQVLELLEQAKNDSIEGFVVMEENAWTSYFNSMKESRDLISKVETLLHNIGT